MEPLGPLRGAVQQPAAAPDRLFVGAGDATRHGPATRPALLELVLKAGQFASQLHQPGFLSIWHH